MPSFVIPTLKVDEFINKTLAFLYNTLLVKPLVRQKSFLLFVNINGIQIVYVVF